MRIVKNKKITHFSSFIFHFFIFLYTIPSPIKIKFMLSVIISQSPVVRDAFVSALSLEKQPQEEVQYSVYKR